MPHAEPHNAAEARHDTAGASSMFSGGKAPEEKKTRKWTIIGVVVGIVGLVVVLLLHRSSSASSGASTTAAGTTTPLGEGTGTISGGVDYSGLASQMQQLENTLASQSSTASASASNPTASTSGTTTGGLSSAQLAAIKLAPNKAGWWAPYQYTNNPSNSGQMYDLITSLPDLQSLPKGTQLYYQPAPGVFAAAPAHPVSGTPLYIQQS